MPWGFVRFFLAGTRLGGCAEPEGKSHDEPSLATDAPELGVGVATADDREESDKMSPFGCAAGSATGWLLGGFSD